jgi:hypothetical protein
MVSAISAAYLSSSASILLRLSHFSAATAELTRLLFSAEKRMSLRRFFGILLFGVGISISFLFWSVTDINGTAAAVTTAVVCDEVY